MAGYIFDSSQVDEFSKEWGAHLKKARVPYTHMKDMVHFREPFDVLTKESRKALINGMLETIGRRAEHGFGVCIVPDLFDKYMPEEWIEAYDNAYTMAARYCMEQVRSWANTNQFEGQIAYFFDKGGSPGPRWNEYIHRLANERQLERRYRYFSHTMACMRAARPIQAADFLVYELGKHYSETHAPQTNKRSTRYPFKHLIAAGKSCEIAIHTRTTLEFLFVDLGIDDPDQT